MMQSRTAESAVRAQQAVAIRGEDELLHQMPTRLPITGRSRDLARNGWCDTATSMTSLPATARRTLGTILLAMTSGCLTPFPAQPPLAPEPTFDPTTFFAGRTQGEGTLNGRGGSRRTLRVEGLGRHEADGTFRLDQTVTFGDGVVEHRMWRLRRVDAGRYTATLSDAKGEVRAESSGNLFHLRYLLRQPEVYMEQWLYLQSDGRPVLNWAQVTVFGIPWARLSETITRGDGAMKQAIDSGRVKLSQ